MKTCRCPMCGAKNAGRTTGRKDYARCGVSLCENGVRGFKKRAARKQRRTREKRQWKNEATS